MNKQRCETIKYLEETAQLHIEKAREYTKHNQMSAAATEWAMSLEFLERTLKYALDPIRKKRLEKKIQDVKAEQGVSTCKTDRKKEDSAGAIDEPSHEVRKVASDDNITFEKIAGLEQAKEALRTAFVYPVKYPTFVGNGLSHTSNILLYGPPGTGKTELARATATELSLLASNNADGKQHTYKMYSITSADVFDKYQGESEKTIRRIFEEARSNSPSVIFIDEVDSILSERSDTNSESSTRVKTMFMTEMSGIQSDTAPVVVIAATNIPWNIDDAIRRRFQKKIYVPLPDEKARKKIFQIHTSKIKHELSDSDFDALSSVTEGYSGSDISNFVKDVSRAPFQRYKNAQFFKRVAEDSGEKLVPCNESDEGAEKMTLDDIANAQIKIFPVSLSDFMDRIGTNKKSVGQDNIDKFKDFTNKYGIDAD